MVRPDALRPWLIGYWASDESPEWPSPESFVDTSWDPVDRSTVADYLRQGLMTRACMGLSPCRICGAANGSIELTDTVYVWPEGLSHYLSEHSVRPPQEFIDHVMESLIWLDEAKYETGWWQRHSSPAE